MRIWTLVLCTAVAACGGSAVEDRTTTPAKAPATATTADPGLKTMVSQHRFADTVTRLEAAITGKGLRVFTKIDHAANAKGAGLALPPTTIIIFGKPQVGTELMATSRSVAIDLPQKMLVWQDGTTVNITYNDPAWLQARHGLDAKAALLKKISGLLGAVANQAAH